MRGKNTAAHSVVLFLVLFWAAFLLSGCSHTSDMGTKREEINGFKDRDTDISGELSYEKSMVLQYAKKFAVDYYEDGYVLLSVADGRRYLIVPEGKEPPWDLRDGIIVLKRPFSNIYLVASAVMDMFRELSAIDLIGFSGQEADGWCIPEAKEAMAQGNMLYAGKYNMPDYELIVAGNCSLAIENNMISHSPEVVEKLEDFGIPTLIDLSSYENHPLGRVEWIRLYGALLGREEEAEQAFFAQREILNQITEKEASDKTVAFFYITTNGMVNVRVKNDYVPKMIALAGGKYIFDNLGDEDSVRSSMTMQMEEFYKEAKEADYLIYNSTIEGGLTSIDELLQKEALLGDFKAVKEKRVWCTTRDLYQQSMSIGQMIEDIHSMLSDDMDAKKEMKYLYQLQ